MAHKYAFQDFDAEKMARAIGIDLPISTKQSIEICNALRKKGIEKAKTILKDAITKKQPIAFKRFNKDMGHKKGKIAAGRYPIKSCENILRLLESAEANANQKSLGNLIITHICAHRGAQTWHYGRQSRIKMKRTTIEIVVEESKPEIKETRIEQSSTGDKNIKGVFSGKTEQKKPIEKKEVVEEKK